MSVNFISESATQREDCCIKSSDRILHVGLDVPNNNETNSGDGNEDILDENRNNEGGPMLLASLVMVTMVMVTTVMALLTVLVATTAIMLATHLSVVTLLVKEKRK